jgi:hypothetical protein
LAKFSNLNQLLNLLQLKKSEIKVPRLEVKESNCEKGKEVTNIYQIADRIPEHSDIWKCKTCENKGDKWDLLGHYPYCKNNQK